MTLTTKKPTAVEFWQTEACTRSSHGPISIPAPLMRAMRDAAQRRARDTDFVAVEQVARLMVASAIERYLVSIGEPIGVDLVSIVNSERRAGVTPLVLMTPEEAEAFRARRRFDAQESDVVEKRRHAKGRLIELCARLSTMKPIDVQPSDIELLSITAEQAGETLDQAVRDAGLRTDHPAVRWLKQVSHVGAK